MERSLGSEKVMLKILAETTGQTAEKIDRVIYQLFHAFYDIIQFLSGYSTTIVLTAHARLNMELLIKSSISRPRQLMKC